MKKEIINYFYQQLQNNNKVDDYEEYETRTKIEKEVIITSSTVFNIIA